MHSIIPGFLMQTRDTTGTVAGGESFYGGMCSVFQCMAWYAAGHEHTCVLLAVFVLLQNRSKMKCTRGCSSCIMGSW